jgi:hypothetical protein
MGRVGVDSSGGAEGEESQKVGVRSALLGSAIGVQQRTASRELSIKIVAETSVRRPGEMNHWGDS